MFDPIRCFCGRETGSLMPLFCALRDKEVKSGNIKISNPKLIYTLEYVRLKEAFEQLKISKVCCKTRMISCVRFDSLY